MKVLLTIACAATMLIGTAAQAAPCRGAHGRFVRCSPASAASPAPAAAAGVTRVGNRCRDSHGRFVRCPAAH